MTTANDFTDACIAQHLPIGEALARLEQAHKRILLIVDERRALLGVVTDSNFRRAMLARTDFSAPVSQIMTTKPVVARPGMPPADILTLMERTHCHELPVIGEAGEVTGLILIEEVLTCQRIAKPREAVVMAGGLGLRLRPLTDSTPKPLLPVGGQPILFTLLDQLIAARFALIHVAVHHMAEAIRTAVLGVPRYRSMVRFLEEPQRLGTMGALSLLPERPTCPLLVTNADLLTRLSFEDMLRFHDAEENAVTVALREERHPVPYGIATLEGTRIVDMVEKPVLTHHVNAGVYVLNPDVVDSIPAGIPVDAPDVIRAVIARGERVGSFPVREYWVDIGLPEQLQRARRDFGHAFEPVAMQDEGR